MMLMTDLPVHLFISCSHLVFSEWTEWNECPVSCGGGIQYRDRNKTIVEGNAIHVSFEDESRYCNTQPCPPGKNVYAASECCT